MNNRLLIATRNHNKKKELAEMLSTCNIEVLTLDEIESLPEVEEDGETFADNAIKKAKTIAILSGYHCLADDSGLVVDALGGEPGVYSARYAGKNADDHKNNQKLLKRMENIEEGRRTARFVCVIAVSDPQGNVETVQGVCEGRIGLIPSGTRGFGYDPLFIPLAYTKTFAELSAEEKNSISHRGQALKGIKPVLHSIFSR